MYRTANMHLPPAQLRGPAAHRETNTSLVFRLGRLRVLEALSNPGLGRRNRRLVVVVVVVSFNPPFYIDQATIDSSRKIPPHPLRGAAPQGPAGAAGDVAPPEGLPPPRRSYGPPLTASDTALEDLQPASDVAQAAIVSSAPR